MIALRLFAAARQAAGRAADTFEMAAGSTLADLLAAAVDRYGPAFEEVLGTSRVWINGDEPSGGLQTALVEGDEVAVLPPVSGGDH